MQFLDNSRHLFRIWRANARASIVREMEFRSNFFLSIFRQMSWAAAFVFMIEIIFRNTKTLSGWTKPDVLIILALSRIIEGVMDTLFSRNISDLPSAVQKGEFDFNLLKPGPIQFYTAFRRVNIHNIIGHIGVGFVILLYALSQRGFPDLLTWIKFIIMVALSVTIFYSIMILLASFVFFVERLQSLWSFMGLMSEPLTVPFDIFPVAPRLALTYGLPLAFIVFVPAQALTGRLLWWQILVGAIIAGILVLASNLLWRAGLRRYTSASS